MSVKVINDIKINGKRKQNFKELENPEKKLKWTELILSCEGTPDRRVLQTTQEKQENYRGHFMKSDDYNTTKTTEMPAISLPINTFYSNRNKGNSFLREEWVRSGYHRNLTKAADRTSKHIISEDLQVSLEHLNQKKCLLVTGTKCHIRQNTEDISTLDQDSCCSKDLNHHNQKQDKCNNELECSFSDGSLEHSPCENSSIFQSCNLTKEDVHRCNVKNTVSKILTDVDTVACLYESVESDNVRLSLEDKDSLISEENNENITPNLSGNDDDSNMSTQDNKGIFTEASPTNTNTETSLSYTSKESTTFESPCKEDEESVSNEELLKSDTDNSSQYAYQFSGHDTTPVYMSDDLSSLKDGCISDSGCETNLKDTLGKLPSCTTDKVSCEPNCLLSCDDVVPISVRNRFIEGTSFKQKCKVDDKAKIDKTNGSSCKATSILNFFSPIIQPRSSLRSTKVLCSKDQLESIHNQPVNLNTQKGNDGYSLDCPVRKSSRLKSQTPLHGKTKTKSQRTKSPRNTERKLEQLYIDAGQKDFGHVSCPTCGMVYTKAQEEDEIEHANYHQRLMHKLKFKGWKTERVLQLYDDGKIVLINPNDHRLHLKKVTEVREVVDFELGFTVLTNGFSSKDEKAFLFINQQRVIGCVIAVAIRKAFPIIPSPDIPSPEKKQGVPTLSWCCSTVPVPALCGISRIWVIKHLRRRKIAQRLIDCVRNNFIFGCVIEKDQIAFSDPTPDGRAFAEKYTGSSHFLVFH